MDAAEEYPGFVEVEDDLPPLPEKAATARTNPQAKSKGASSGPRPITLYRGGDYRQAPKREMVVKGLLGAGEVTFTHGAAKSGKSFLMTSCALAVAEGAASWWGHRIKRPGQVLYLVQEGAGGFPTRLEAWSRTHGRPVPENFVWTPTRLRFVEEGSKGAAVEDVRRVAEAVARLEAETGEPVVLIIVDTAARVTTGADENSARDMGLFLEACAALQDLPSRPHVNVVAHDNAGGRLRGSTAQLGGGDGFIHVERQGEARSWCLEIAKDDVETEKRGFALETVDLGIDEDGDPVRSCVVVEATAPAVMDKPVRLTDSQDNAVRCLERAVADHGASAPPGSSIPPNSRVVSLERWVDAVVRWMPSEDGDDIPRWRRKDRLKRTGDALRAKGRIRYQDGLYWLPSQTSPTSQKPPMRGSGGPSQTSHPSQGSLEPGRWEVGRERAAREERP